VPHGDPSAARQARRLCAEAGLRVSAYGSYYRAAGAPGETPPFDAVLASALELGAPSIRVWAGNIASADAASDHRHRIADDLRRIADLAQPHDCRIALEYHGGTLTDTPDSTLRLLQDVGHSNVRTYWQPRHGLSIEQNLADLNVLAPYLQNIHVFHWWPDHRTRLPLAEGFDRWTAYTSAIRAIPGEHVFSHEFVRNDDPHQLSDDARTLHHLLQADANRT
ncbi:MAG: sugar phosphate isomerase/epimerase family protein, partial [Tepidisphaeraceae bacterium]